MPRTLFVVIAAAWSIIIASSTHARGDEPIYEIGSRLELFVDRFLIDSMTNVQHVLHHPRDEGQVLARDQDWEDERPHFGFGSVLRDHDRYRMYYRGNQNGEVTCLAESPDGLRWTKPKLGLVEVTGSTDNNILFDDPRYTHNFSPFIDTNPKALPEHRYKAIAGAPRNAKADPDATGPFALVSADGIHWKALQDQPVLTITHVLQSLQGLRAEMMFDSQNVAFWSTAENQYVMYFRVYKGGLRRVARAVSRDFMQWSNLELLDYQSSPGEPAIVQDLYMTQLSPYFRAPHIYVGIGARLLSKPERRILSDEEVAAMQLDIRQIHGLSDAVLLSTRGGSALDRPFLEGFIRPGLGKEDWVARSLYPMQNVVQTGPTEMSVYVKHNNGQPTTHVRRHSLRIDGFASLQAPYSGGEVTTKPLRFTGRQLLLNFATSAAGDVSVEIQTESGQPIPGFTLKDAVKTVGNELQRTVQWTSGKDLSELAGQTVRLRFVMRDADLYAFRFSE